MKSYKEPTDMPDRKDFTDNWVRTFKILDEYLMHLIGNKCMVPLYYVVRKDADVVPEADDPPTNYTSRWSEMCIRMPHYTTTAGVRKASPKACSRTATTRLSSNKSRQRIVTIARPDTLLPPSTWESNMQGYRMDPLQGTWNSIPMPI
jgi:hypothetical protein